jgi:dienelactone hydrolase
VTRRPIRSFGVELSMRRLVLLLLALALAGCGGGESNDAEPATTAAPAPPPSNQEIFAFDRGAYLGVTEGETTQQPTFTATPISYASPGGDRVSGIVLGPVGRKPSAGVIFMHGAAGSSIDFLGDASELAKAGAVAMTIDSPFARSASEQVRDGNAPPEMIHELMVRNVQDLVRGFDVLVRHYKVDPKRLAVVGYSMGVQAAATAAAIDGRLEAVVLMAGRARPSRIPGDAAWEQRFRSIDTVHFVSGLAPASVLVQGGESDEVTPRAALQELYEATSEPKQIRWYAAGHGLNPKAGRERVAWLRKRLGLE